MVPPIEMVKLVAPSLLAGAAALFGVWLTQRGLKRQSGDGVSKSLFEAQLASFREITVALERFYLAFVDALSRGGQNPFDRTARESAALDDISAASLHLLPAHVLEEMDNLARFRASGGLGYSGEWPAGERMEAFRELERRITSVRLAMRSACRVEAVAARLVTTLPEARLARQRRTGPEGGAPREAVLT